MAQPKTVHLTLFGINKIFFKIKLCLLLCFFLLSVSKQDSEEKMKKKFIETYGYDPEEKGQTGASDISTTPNPLAKDEQTAIPESAILDALNRDVGIYTTQRFEYFNQQNFRIERSHFIEGQCYDQYIRCLLSQSNLYSVCAYNRLDKRYGYVNLDSYCDVYFDNCRRAYRFWVAYRPGPCRYKNSTRNTYYYAAYEELG